MHALLLQGAGMMAIPRAFNLLGLLPGLAIMALMACLTFFTLAGLGQCHSSHAGGRQLWRAGAQDGWGRGRIFAAAGGAGQLLRHECVSEATGASSRWQHQHALVGCAV